ncbi:Csu type fimbrial protein [Phyllobacterium endophyticum]|uniref:Spore coat protein U n=1 Tax=Phyllobacterium endophyticum TaxID=1149773 RepID=A0A2P7B2T7_9HYPH|nr:spore coat protein U [Phyllobacterium endophyticum]TYR42912.1 spore coat U domain-containing protein [Phyllobacterium endophyticum]
MAAILASCLWSQSPAAAAVAEKLGVRITITSECKLAAASELYFGSHGVLDTNVEKTGQINVQCTTGTPYNVGLDAGIGAGATVAARKMTGTKTGTIDYNLYRDANHNDVWGTTIGKDTLSATGDGATQSINVYGLVLPQVTPAPGDYTDTVAITVNY